MWFFTKKEDKFLKDNYLTIPAKTMSKMLGRTEATARQRMALLGIKVPVEVVERFRKESQFKKGSVPPNKGKKMPPGVYEAVKRTMFKKGNLPQNTKNDLDISIRTDKRGINYKFIRISKAKWIPLHRFNYEKVNGKIPAKMKLIFIDRDTMNCNIENLKLVTPGELMKLNSYHNLPKPLAHIVQLRGALNRQINKHKKLLNEK